MSNQRLLVLEEVVALPGFMDPPDPHQRYDSAAQLWRWIDSGLPVVQEERLEASRYGETTITASTEGADQGEGSRRIASQWGETIQTRTSEGIDQSESSSALRSSPGKTVMANTSENLDQSESSSIATHSH